jgi:hypothetical protein
MGPERQEMNYKLEKNIVAINGFQRDIGYLATMSNEALAVQLKSMLAAIVQLIKSEVDNVHDMREDGAIETIEFTTQKIKEIIASRKVLKEKS